MQLIMDHKGLISPDIYIYIYTKKYIMDDSDVRTSDAICKW